MGDEVPVYSRANLSRTAATVVALLLTAISASAVAREFRAADTRSESHAGDFNRTNVALLGTFVPALNVLAIPFLNRVRPVHSIADIGALRLRVQQSESMSDMIRALGTDSVELPYGQVLTGLATRLIAKAQRDPAAAQLIERIRKVE